MSKRGDMKQNIDVAFRNVFVNFYGIYMQPVFGSEKQRKQTP